MTITAAADGSALGNPGPAGWAWYIDDDTWRAGGWPHGTNNMGELKAVLDLLESTASEPSTAGEPLLVLCDSQYVINSVTKWMPGWKRKGWKKRDGKPVQNVELMKAIDAALQGREVSFEWVKGHAGHPMNEAADRRANNAATAFSRNRAPETGPGLDGFSSPAVSTEAGEGVKAAETAADAEDADDMASLASLASESELALSTDAVRGDRDALASLLHPELTVIDSEGQLLDREAVLAQTAPLRGFRKVEVTDVVTEIIGPDTVTVRSLTTGPYGSVLRTSVWVRAGGGDGSGVVLRIHQQTPRR